MVTKNLVFVCGIDGSGKSTLCSFLQTRGYSISNYEVIKNTKFSNGLDYKNPSKKLSKLKGKRRVDLINRWMNAEKRYLDYSFKQSHSVITDGYYLRFFAKELTFQIIKKDVASSFIDTDYKKYFLMLDIEPKISLRRKIDANQEIKAYETFDQNSISEYLKFQQTQRTFIKNHIRLFPHKVLDSNQSSKDSIGEQAMLFLNENKIIA